MLPNTFFPKGVRTLAAALALVRCPAERWPNKPKASN